MSFIGFSMYYARFLIYYFGNPQYYIDVYKICFYFHFRSDCVATAGAIHKILVSLPTKTQTQYVRQSQRKTGTVFQNLER